MNSRSIPLALLALFLLHEPLHAAPVFLENVSESGGWYDCNKKTKWTWGTKPDPFNPLNPPVSARPSVWSSLPLDTQLCWAAAASNRSPVVAGHQERSKSRHAPWEIRHLQRHAAGFPISHLPDHFKKLDE